MSSEQESLPPLPIAVRPMREDDLPFLTDSWLRSFREGNFGVPHDEYFETQRRVIKSLLRQSKAAIACDPNDADQVFGYVVWHARQEGKPLVHWCFVKHPFRRFGVCRHLMKVVDPEKRGVLLTHRSIHYPELAKAGLRITYAPFALVSCLVSGGGEDRKR